MYPTAVPTHVSVVVMCGGILVLATVGDEVGMQTGE